MQNTDFELTDMELAKLNQVVRKISREQYASEGEPANDVSVCFAFGVPFLRFITVSVSGSTPIDLDEVELDPVASS